MLKTLALVLPALVPSWRFFKAIEPSPRVQWAVFDVGEPPTWREIRPRPENVLPFQAVLRLFWNAAWNETLFVVSCAERIQEQPTPHSIGEIQQRLRGDIRRRGIDASGMRLRFRLVFVHRERTELVERVVFLSDEFRAV